MAKPTPEERRLHGEQARQLKAEIKAAAAEERRAQKAARKARKKGGAEPVAEPTDEAPAPLPAQPRLELVTQPGPIKHIHWDAEERARVAAAEAVAQPRLVPPAAAPAPLREAPSEVPQVLAGRRRTLYTTDHGNKVVAYESGGRRQLAITEERDGRLQEVPFDESQVDRLIGAEPESLQEAIQETAPPVEEKPKRSFWRRRKEAAPAPPVAEHIYRPVETVPTLVATEPEPAPIAQKALQVDAWEPGAALRQVHRAERAPSTRPAPTTHKPEPVARAAPRKRRAARKPLRIYPGDNHPVIDIEGIGPAYAKKLAAMGITTTGLLNVAKPRRVAARLHVPLKTVKKWQAESELIKVRGIGPQFAEALARSGITGIDELKRRKADDLAKQVAKYLASVGQNVVGQPLTAKRIARWKRKAQPMRRVKADPKKLAIPTHGIPPPWLREEAKGKAKKAARKTAKKGARKVARPVRRKS